MSKKKIVVMGGSFNPPTLAHYRLMEEALKALEADKGFFVPVSDAYLKRKMRRCHPPIVLSPEMRIAMLQTMCTDSRMSVCEKEIGTIEPRTQPTLKALQEDYPEADLYFLMGADKLKLLVLLTEKKNFLDDFKVVLYSREKERVAETLKGNKLLSRYMDRIVTLPQPEGIDEISSSKIREYMLAGVSCQDMLCPGVWDLFKDFKPADFPDMICRFSDEYDFLDNSYNCPFVWQGQRYDNAEAAFQSSKCADRTERKSFSRCSAHKAVLKGNKLVPLPGWEDACRDIMASILKAKFEQNPDLMRRLVETGNRILVHGNNKREQYWGVDLYSWQGKNNLGKIIMNIRDKEISK